MDINEQPKVKGIKIKTLNTAMIVLASLVFLALIYNTVLLAGQYHGLITHTEEYMACEKDAQQLRDASDYLTEQVRLYVENMDIKNMENYFSEVHEGQRRDAALAELKQHETSQEVQDSLESAMACSNDLMEREIYAMKLISVANGYMEDSLPQEVREVQFKASDAALSRDEMIENARTLVFDKGYQDAKALIYSHLDHFLNGILNAMDQRQKDSEDSLGQALSRQRWLISILFVLNVVTFVAITILIVRPLTIYIKRIKENGMLDITGSYEFKYLAITYNDIYEINAENQAALTRKAEHDPLTGVLNRGAFENLKQYLKEGNQPLALLIVDLDQFKEINDRFGHEVGDQILKKTSALLINVFRATDYVARLGGDEFAVVMSDITRDNMSVLARKIDDINRSLNHPVDGLPATSISVGAAFSEHGFPEELYRQADQALYEVKESGRCGIKAYQKH